MVLQSEAVNADEDIEHFEDIKENDGNQVISTSGNSDNKGQVAETSHASDDDSEESLREDGSASSDSEGEGEADDLFGEDGSDKAVKLNSKGDSEVDSSHQVPTPTPGGYDPRHREPSYW